MLGDYVSASYMLADASPSMEADVVMAAGRDWDYRSVIDGLCDLGWRCETEPELFALMDKLGAIVGLDVKLGKLVTYVLKATPSIRPNPFKASQCS